MRISDWSSDVCSSDLHAQFHVGHLFLVDLLIGAQVRAVHAAQTRADAARGERCFEQRRIHIDAANAATGCDIQEQVAGSVVIRSEEHTSELQSLMRISYAVFCLKNKTLNMNREG